MAPQHERSDRRAAVDAKLTELMLYAKELCRGALVDISSLQYENENATSKSFPLAPCPMPRWTDSN
jgi:hypothetical protein